MVRAFANSFDQSVVNKLNEWAHDHAVLVQVAKVATWFGNGLTLTVIVLAAVTVLVTRRHRWPAIYLATAASAGGLLNSLLKDLIGRSRPIVEHPILTIGSRSFPSGHAMSSTVIYGALLLVFLPVIPRRWQPAVMAATVTLVLAIGTSRVVLGVHYPSDVVAGHVIGLAVLLGCTFIFSSRRKVTLAVERPRGTGRALAGACRARRG
ncbi:MAG: hypothetical protein QOC92_609 [Acidimicrobiaceae bacterium]|jgi:undecaprenyl-diphosphatase